MSNLIGPSESPASLPLPTMPPPQRSIPRRSVSRTWSVLALALPAVVAGGALWLRPHPRVAVPPPGAVGEPPPAPDLDWVLDRKAQFALTPAQVRRLEALRTRQEAESSSLRTGLSQEADRLTRVMGTGSGPDLRHLTDNAGTVTELSGRLAAIRAEFWKKAAVTLTAVQRQQVEAIWTRSVSPIRTEPEGSEQPEAGKRRERVGG